MADDVTVVNTESGYIVAIEDFDGEVVFAFEDIFERQHEITAQLTVSRAFLGENPETFSERINILSSSAKNTLRLNLDAMWDSPKGFWAGKINKACEAMRLSLIEHDRSIDLSGVDVDGQMKYLIHPTIPEDGHTIWFGAGQSAKTYLLLAMCVTMAYGLDAYGYSGPPKPILFIDYESGERILKRRLNRLATGFGIALTPSFYREMFHYWPGQGRPLTSMLPALKRKVKHGDVGLIVIDSAALAAGGNPKDEQVALAYFNAVQSLNVPCVSIAHITKEEDDRYPLGTIFWHTSARATWFVTAAEMVGLTKKVALLPKKGNEDAPHKPIGFEIDFGEDGSTVITRTAVSHVFDDNMTLSSRIRKLLLANGKLKMVDMVEALNEKRGTISKAIGAMPDVMREGKVGSHDVVYFVYENSPATP